MSHNFSLYEPKIVNKAGHTCFFRIPSHYKLLRKWILPMLFANKLRGRVLELPTIRIFSAGCSTGQEPYSIAMSVFDDRVLPDMCGLEIIACDIDQESIRFAKEGIYSENDVSCLKEEYKERHFTVEDGIYRLKDIVKNMVKYSCVNILDDVLPGKFDVIFCRNVIVHLEPDEVISLVNRLVLNLNEGGYLFTGLSEPLIGLEDDLEFIDLSVGFTYRKMSLQKLQMEKKVT